MVAMSIVIRTAVTNAMAVTLLEVGIRAEFLVSEKVHQVDSGHERQPHAHPISLAVAHGSQDNVRNAGVDNQTGFS